MNGFQDSYHPEFFPIMIGYFLWAADLADIKNLSRYNKGVKYLLTVVDVLSKYAWVVPMKNKTGAEQKRAFESILKVGRKPLRLQTDKGSEFYNKSFEEYLT